MYNSVWRNIEISYDSANSKFYTIIRCNDKSTNSSHYKCFTFNIAGSELHGKQSKSTKEAEKTEEKEIEKLSKIFGFKNWHLVDL